MFKLTVFNCIFVFSWLYGYPTIAQIGDTRCCRKIADVAFVVDTSTSIYIENFKLQLKAIHAIVDLFDVGPGKARFAAVSFSDRVVPQFHFNSFSTRSQVLDAIDNIRYPGGQLTCLNLGIEYMRRILFNSGNGARHGVPQVVVVFTDGNINCGYDSLTSTKAKEVTIKEADFAKRSGLSMFAVGIGPNVNINVLKAIASAPVNRFMQTVPSDSKMDTTEFRHFITNNICIGSDITPLPILKPVITDARISPPTRSLPRYTRISLPTRLPPVGDTRCCRKVADVAFVVDTSSSINIEDFKLQLKAIHAIVDLFDVGIGKARFAAVSFSDRVVPQFNFNSFSTRSQVLDAVNNIRYPEGQLTCLNWGIGYMRRILFNSGNGARHGVPQVVVVFTDGNINCGYDSLTSTKAKEDTIKEADFAKRSGLSMFAVGIGPNVNINVLKAIASAPVNRFMQTVPSDSKMDTTEFRHFITNNICTGCDITPLPILKPVITDVRISPQTRSLPRCTRISLPTRPPPGSTSVNRDQFKLGTFPPGDSIARMTPVQSILRENDTIPQFFDARKKWPNFIHPPDDQGNCSGSWAFSTAGVAADRVAIESNGTYTGKLSVQQLLSCAQEKGKDGCSGGYIDRAWQFTRNNSILAAAFYERIDSDFAGKCVRSLTSINSYCDGGVLVFIRMTPPYRIGNKEEDIMTEIMYNGPVQAMMAVNEGLYRYKSGIYRYPTGIRLDQLNHSVKIIGLTPCTSSIRSPESYERCRKLPSYSSSFRWGEERLENGENRNYWICANSWGQQWGENGTFKVERGAFEEFTVIVAAHLSLFGLKGTPTVGSIERLGHEFTKILDGLVLNNINMGALGDTLGVQTKVRVEWRELALMLQKDYAYMSLQEYRSGGAKAALIDALKRNQQSLPISREILAIRSPLYDAIKTNQQSLPITQETFIRGGRITFRRKKVRKTE